MASGKIRGITIELSGDTKGLVKSLNTAKSSIKGVQTQLKDVNKVLKLDPSSTTLLTQKQDLLKKQVEETESALEQQKKALEELQNSADSDKTKDAQDALQREIVETEAKLKDAQKELKNFGSVGAQQFAVVGEKVKEVGQGIADFGDSMTKKVSVPLVALGTASVKAFTEVDKGEDAIIKKTGATGEAFEEMKGIMEDLAKSIPTDFETAGNAVGEVNTRFGVTGDELEALSEKFIKFAQLNDTDVSTSIDNVQSAMAMFGLGSQDAGNFLDTLNSVAQSTGVNVDTLSSSLLTNGTALKEMGFNASDSATFLGNLEKNGVDASATMAGLKKALANASAEGKPMSEALDEIQDSLLNATDSQEAMNLASELFGTKAGPAIASAVRDGRLSFEQLNTSLEDAGGNIETTFEETIDPIDEFKMTLNTLMVAGAQLGTTLLTMLAPVLEKITQKIEQLSNWFKQLSPQTQELIVKIGLVMAVIFPLLSIIGRLVIGVGQIMTFAPAIVGGLTTIGGVITGTVLPAIGSVLVAIAPVALVIAGIIAVGVLLWKHWDEISAFAIKTWETIKEKVTTAVTNLKNKVVTTWTNIKNTVTTTINNLKTSITTTWNNIKNAVQTTVENLKTSIVTMWNNLKTTVTTTITNLKTSITTVWTNIQTAVSNTVTDIKTKVSNVFTSLKTSVSKVWNGIKTAITSPIESAKTLVSNAISKIKGMFPLSIGKIFSNLKLPHINISGGKAPFGIGGMGTKPSISVDWYKRASEAGAIFNREALFGFQNGKFLGAGDASQPEMLLGKNTLLNMISGAVSAGMNSDAIYNAVLQGTSNAKVSVYIDGKDVTGIVNKHNTSQQLNRLRMQGA